MINDKYIDLRNACDELNATERIRLGTYLLSSAMTCDHTQIPAKARETLSNMVTHNTRLYQQITKGQ